MDGAVINITFRHIEPSDVVSTHARTQLVKLEKFLAQERSPILIDLVIESLPIHAQHRVELLVKTPHYDLVAHDEGTDLYLTIDSVLKTMLGELRKAKERRVDTNRSSPLKK